MDKVIDLTRYPDYLLVDEDGREAWDAALNLSTLISTTDPDRQWFGQLWDTRFWTPGCLVCALGAVAENLIPEEELVLVTRYYPSIRTLLHPLYQQRYGPIDWSAFGSACEIILRLNDGYTMSFERIHETIQAGHADYYQRHGLEQSS